MAVLTSRPSALAMVVTLAATVALFVPATANPVILAVDLLASAVVLPVSSEDGCRVGEGEGF